MKVDQRRVGSAIRLIRKSRGLTQPELARKVGVTVNYLSLLENGLRGISIEKLNSLAVALKIPVPLIMVLGCVTTSNMKPEMVKLLKQLQKSIQAIVAVES